MKYRLWPYIKLNDTEYSMPDELLYKIYTTLISDGKLATTFYGEMNTEFVTFVAYIKNPKNHFVFVLDDEKKEFVFMAWLNAVEKTAAYCHFTGIGPHRYKPAIGKLIIQYWESTKVPLVLIGTIPEINKAGIKLALNLGFKELGDIPKLCYIKKEEKAVKGKILYYVFGEEE